MEECKHEETIEKIDSRTMRATGTRIAMIGELYNVQCKKVCKNCGKVLEYYEAERTMDQIYHF